MRELRTVSVPNSRTLTPTCVWRAERLRLVVALDDRFGEPVDAYVNGSQVWLRDDGPGGVTVEWRLHPVAAYRLPESLPAGARQRAGFAHPLSPAALRDAVARPGAAVLLAVFFFVTLGFAPCTSLRHSSFTKKKVLFLMIGPPIFPPNMFKRSSGVGTFCCLKK